MVRNYRQLLEQKKGRRDQTMTDLNRAEEDLSATQLRVIYCEEAATILQNIAQVTQEQLTYHISELVTLAMAAVFDNPYELKVEFVLRRNRTEADISFVRDGKSIDPMSASGGGAVDVAAFALRVALWSLSQPKTRNVLVLDEPLHFLKGDVLPEKGSIMMQEISSKLGLQMIMVSHIPEQVSGSDKVHTISIRNGVSMVN